MTLNFNKIICDIRPLETCLTQPKIYPSLESDCPVDASQNPFLGGYGLCSLTEDQQLLKHLLTTSDGPVWNPKTFLVCNVCSSFGALDNYASLVFQSRIAAIL